MRIIVTGLIAQHPMLGGVAWDYLQYPLGLRLLGHEVYYFEDSGEWPYNLDGGVTGQDWVARDCDANVEHLRSVMDRIGLRDQWAYRFPTESRWYGLPDSRRREVTETADLLINVSGTLEHPEHYRTVPVLAYIDSDPVFTQVKIAKGDQEFSRRVAVHDVHFTFGEDLSDRVPQTPYNWLPTRQPIVLEEWIPLENSRQVFTTVMSWTSYKPLTYDGMSYGQKDVEFQKFLDLPSRLAGVTLEVALGQTEHPNWSAANDPASEVVEKILKRNPDISARDLLRQTGWRVTNAFAQCGSLETYRDYIRSSKGEWSVAKNGYVIGQAGWFSCRSACYLAAGRPVVVQDTGFRQVLPTGTGLLPFASFEDAVEAVRTVDGDLHRHSKAARDIAYGFFDSNVVLSALIDGATRIPLADNTEVNPRQALVLPNGTSLRTATERKEQP